MVILFIDFIELKPTLPGATQRRRRTNFEVSDNESINLPITPQERFYESTIL